MILNLPQDEQNPLGTDEMPFKDFQQFLKHMFQQQTQLHDTSINHTNGLVDSLRDDFDNKLKLQNKKFTDKNEKN